MHDNVGQLLSVAKINLNILEDSITDSENQEYIKQTNDLVGQTILDLRILTKNLNDDLLQQFELQENIAQELLRIRKNKKNETEIILDGDVYALGYECEIVLFRIFQEFLDHSIKYSGAKNINVKLSYGDQNFNLYLSDDGKQFGNNEVVFNKIGESIAGIDNIQRRCVLIGGKCNYESKTGKGIKINIELPNPNYTKSTV